ncbi:MAG: TraB/GumN family protein [Chitinophagales bacterium]
MSMLPSRYFFWLALLLLSLPSRAQESVLVRWVPENSGTPSYILAILHNTEAARYPLSNVPYEVFPLVNTVAFEWLEESYETEQAKEIMQLREELNLKRYLERDDNIRYELFIINNLQENVEQYAGLMPFYTMQLFRDFLRGEGRTYQEELLYQYALEETKPVLSMLSMRNIAEYMATVPSEQQADVLSRFVNDQDLFATYEHDKAGLYRNQSLTELGLLVTGTEQPAWLQAMLTRVNRDLVAQMMELSAGQSVLYILDAERIGGPGGIVPLLLEEGAEVSDMPFTLSSDAEIEEYYTGTNELQADQFPDYLLDNLSDRSGYAVRNRIIKVDELQAGELPPAAITDPFGDGYDYLGTDTSFISEWFELRSNDAYFSIRMPEKTKWEETLTESINGNIKSVQAQVNHARSDLFYSIGYTIYPPNFDPGIRADFFDDFVYRSIRKINGQLVTQRIISDPEYVGREFVVSVDDSFYVRSQIILRGNILYQILCGGPDNKPYAPYAEEFIRSFRLDRGKATNWYTYLDQQISCQFPRQPLIQNQNYPTQYGQVQVKTFNTEDFDTQLSYFLSINQYPDGYPVKGSKSFYNGLISDAERQYFGRAVSVTKVRKGRNKGVEAVLQLNNGKVYRMHFFVVDKVLYQYLVGGTASAMESAGVDYFLDHFLISDQ